MFEILNKPLGRVVTRCATYAEMVRTIKVGQSFRYVREGKADG